LDLQINVTPRRPYVFKPDFEPPDVIDVGSIVRVDPDPDTHAVIFTMKQSEKVQGFMLYKVGDPFYSDAFVSVGEVTEDSFIPPPGVYSPLQVASTTVLDPDRPIETFRLGGMQPLGPRGSLNLKQDTTKPVPAGGYHLRVLSRRNVSVENRNSSYSSERAFALNDIVGELPYPASYQTPESLIDALYASIDHALAADPVNSRNELTARQLLNLTYNISTCKYLFACGPQGARIDLTMQRNLALLFGFDYPDEEHTTIRFASVPRYNYDADPSNATREWSREGHEIVYRHNVDEVDKTVLPVDVVSTYPVTPSLGTEMMYVRTDIIADGASIIQGERSNVIAVVPADWSKDGANVHMPVSKVAIPIKGRTISSVKIKIEDAHGDNIRFMPYDNLPVTVNFLLNRGGRQ
jgi:hypothetical protein